MSVKLYPHQTEALEDLKDANKCALKETSEKIMLPFPVMMGYMKLILREMFILSFKMHTEENEN